MKRLSTICIFLATLLLPLQVSLAQPRRLSADFPKWAGVADTPQMGWSSWNCFMTDINEDLIKATADAMVQLGLVDAGYVYLNLDDGWHGERDENGFVHEDPVKFPSGMKALADYLHARGLKLGIYSDAGNFTCQSERRLHPDAQRPGTGRTAHPLQHLRVGYQQALGMGRGHRPLLADHGRHRPRFPARGDVL